MSANSFTTSKLGLSHKGCFLVLYLNNISTLKTVFVYSKRGGAGGDYRAR